MLSNGTDFEVHNGWKSNLEPAQKEFFQKNAKTTDVHVGRHWMQQNSGGV